MADSEGRAIKSELASRAKDKDGSVKEVPYDNIKESDFNIYFRL